MAENANNYLQNAIIKHAILVQRYANGETRRVVEELKILAQNLRRVLSSKDNEFQRQNINVQIAEIETLIDHLFEKTNDIIDEVADDSTEDQSLFMWALLNHVARPRISRPVTVYIVKSVFKEAMSLEQGVSDVKVRDLVTKMTTFLKETIKKELQDGYLKNVPVSVVADTIETMLTTVGERNAKAVMTTLINHISTQVVRAYMDENPAVFDHYKWVSVLDGRTTLLCAGRHGRIYRRNNGPVPPAHYNCRSKIIPIAKTEFAKKFPRNESNIDSFDKWLRAQSEDFQLEYLGPERYDIYKRGKLTIDKFRDELGRTYTLEQLQQLYGVILNA